MLVPPPAWAEGSPFPCMAQTEGKGVATRPEFSGGGREGSLLGVDPRDGSLVQDLYGRVL